MYALEIAVVGLVAAACLRTFLAFARRNETRRAHSMHRGHADDRDSLGRFRRIIGR